MSSCSGIVGTSTARAAEGIVADDVLSWVWRSQKDLPPGRGGEDLKAGAVGPSQWFWVPGILGNGPLAADIALRLRRYGRTPTVAKDSDSLPDACVELGIMVHPGYHTGRALGARPFLIDTTRRVVRPGNYLHKMLLEEPRPGRVLICASRTVDYGNALVQALESGRIRTAIVVGWDEEALPLDHVWRARSGFHAGLVWSRSARARLAAEQFARNVDLLFRREPLEGLV